MILIGRGLSLGRVEQGKKLESCSVLSARAFRGRESGGDSMMETPVPIPNTEVKHHSGEDSAKVRQ